jgi:hypothetical protein
MKKIKYIIKLQYVINQIYTNLVKGDRLLTRDHSLEGVEVYDVDATASIHECLSEPSRSD